MSTEDGARATTKIASGAITKYRAVVINGENTAIITPNALACNGISGMTVADKESFPMNFTGEPKIELGATLAAGVEVSTNSSGQAVAKAAASNVTIGTLVTGGVSGDIVRIAFNVKNIAVS